MERNRKNGKIDRKIYQYTRAELVKITTKRFCSRHNVNSIKEYQEKYTGVVPSEFEPMNTLKRKEGEC